MIKNYKYITIFWIKYKLSELATHFDYGLNASATKFDGINKYLRITDIDESTRRFDLSNIKSPAMKLDNMDEFILESGDIVFARTGASVGKSYLYNSRDGKVYFAGYLIRIRPKNNTSPKFIFYNTLTSKYSNFVNITSIRSGQPGINANEYRKHQIFVPEITEQDKIAKILSVLDSIITLEQEKYNHFLKLRDQILRMFFYQRWEKSLRIKNDNERWDRISLADILTEKNIKTEINNEFPILSSTNNGLFLQSKYFKSQVASKDNKGYKVLKKDQIVLSPQNLWLGNINFNNKYEIGIVSPSYKVFEVNVNYNKYLIGILLSLDEMKQKYTAASEQGASVVRRNLNIQSFYSIELDLPDIKNQNKISEIIKNLDNQIIISKNLLMNYKKLKKMLLTNLFV